MSNTFTTIARFNYSSEAQIIKGRLEADGIAVFLSDEFTIDTDPLVSQAIGGVKIKVPQEQAEKAKSILESISKYSLTNEGKTINCPNCNNESVQLFSTINSIKSLLAFLTSIFLRLLPFYTKYEYKCEACNTNFNLE
ncbi:DUF2007 domain-containing protein [Aurantibacter sp.]|uniref:putative signal transducing protein n=1 Tax=Aurantibacter sp. TaxID=2807103 RepID=UPI0035C85ECD